MKDKDRYRIKDQIIKFILEANNQSSTILEISEGLKINFHIIHTFADDLIFEGFLENQAEITAKKREWHGDKILLVSPKGQFFFREEGGFKRKYKRDRQRNNWIIAKTLAATANAIIILAVSIWAVDVAKNSNKLVEEIEQKEEVIIELNNEIEALKTEIPDKEIIDEEEN